MCQASTSHLMCAQVRMAETPSPGGLLHWEQKAEHRGRGWRAGAPTGSCWGGKLWAQPGVCSPASVTLSPAGLWVRGPAQMRLKTIQTERRREDRSIPGQKEKKRSTLRKERPKEREDLAKVLERDKELKCKPGSDRQTIETYKWFAW